MKKSTVYAGMVAGLVMGLSSLYAQDQSGSTAGSGAKSTDTQASMKSGDMMTQCMGMMKKMEMSDMMMKRMDAMMKTPIFLDSPCAIYGQRERLGLTEEQKQKLIDIENEAREKSLAVLTAEQKETLGDLPDKPMPMTKMCEKMGARMMPGGMGPGMMDKMSGSMGSGTKAQGSDSKTQE